MNKLLAFFPVLLVGACVQAPPQQRVIAPAAPVAPVAQSVPVAVGQMVPVLDPNAAQLKLQDGQVYPCDQRTGQIVPGSRFTCTWYHRKAQPFRHQAQGPLPQIAENRPTVLARTSCSGYALRYAPRTKHQVAEIIRHDDRKVLRIPAHALMKQVAWRLHRKPWRSLSEFADFIDSENVSEVQATSEILDRHNMGRICGRHVDFRFHRVNPYRGETLLKATIPGDKQEQFFLSDFCLNLIVDRDPNPAENKGSSSSTFQDG